MQVHILEFQDMFGAPSVILDVYTSQAAAITAAKEYISDNDLTVSDTYFSDEGVDYTFGLGSYWFIETSCPSTFNTVKVTAHTII